MNKRKITCLDGVKFVENHGYEFGRPSRSPEIKKYRLKNFFSPKILSFISLNF